jgi:hypothetical protein
MILGLLENAVLVALMFYYQTNWMYFVYFGLVLLVTKILPLVYMWKESITRQDVFVSALVFFVYYVWLTYHKKTLVGLTYEVADSIIHGKHKTPLMRLFSKLSK